MKHTQTIAGILVLALVGAGVYWVRSRSTGPTAVPAEQSPSVGGAGMGDGRRGSAASNNVLPDLTTGEAASQAGDVKLIAVLDPQPPVAFAKFTMRVRAEIKGAPAAIEGGTVSFEMVMPMGDHRYTLVADSAGVQQAAVTLPMCKSGNPRWFATVEGRVAGQPHRARLRLDLAGPR